MKPLDNANGFASTANNSGFSFNDAIVALNEAAVTGDMDPGYGSTSKMIAESAICLVKECPDLAGGIYTPAPAMGEKLITRLQANAGLTFEIEG